MQQLTFLEAGKVEWQDVPEPALEGDGQAIVRPLAVATCDLDSMLVGGDTPYRGPFGLGHEGVAEVVDVGDGVDGLQPGQRVSVSFQIFCGECAPCREGRTASCEATPPMAMYGLAIGGDWGGFLSDAVRVPYAEAMLFPLPDGVDAAAAASASDNMPDAWRTVGPQLARHPGADVLIAGGGGAGSIGVYAAGMAVALGAGRVVYVDPDERQRARAEAYGAEVLDAYPERLGPFAITVDASASHDGLGLALRSTAPDGICTSTGIYFEQQTPVPLLEMYTKGITFQTGRVHAGPAIPHVLELIEGGWDPAPVTNRVAGWDDAPEALVSERGKLVVTR
ncbi:MAG TPA: alcohol dehydrogenase catalytic domain-containing protein [Thermoleophilaceae bacterium]